MNGQEFLIKIDNLLDATKEAYQEFAASTENALRASRPLILAVDEEAVDADSADFKMDQALLKAAPVAVVPAKSEFFPLQENGHRFLLAGDGLYLEVRRPWLHFIRIIAEHHPGVRIPFGRINQTVTLAFGGLGNAIAQMREFADAARQQAPAEHAALIAWDNQEKALKLLWPEPIEAPTATRILYQQPLLAEHESIAIDLHSHGHGPAGFSSVDDADDAGSVKIAGVFGNLDQPVPSVAFRLCVLGLYLPIHVPAEKVFTEGK